MIPLPAERGALHILADQFPRADLVQCQFWDNFHRADENPATAIAPSGQPMIYLDYPTHPRPQVVSHQLRNTDTSKSYYFETQPDGPSGVLKNFGCSGIFLQGSGNTDFTEGVILITDTANSFLPNNYLHLRWGRTAITIEVTNTSTGGLRSVGTFPMWAPIGEEIHVSFVLTPANNQLTFSFCGQTATFYDAAFSESSWNTIIFEQFQGGSTSTQTDNWVFTSIWANAPEPSIVGLTSQARSYQLDRIGMGLGVFTDFDNFFGGHQTIGVQFGGWNKIAINGLTITDPGTLILSGGAHGNLASANSAQGGIVFDLSNDNNWYMAPSVYALGDMGIYRSSIASNAYGTWRAGGTSAPSIPILYFQVTGNLTTIGHAAASAPTGTATLNVEGAVSTNVYSVAGTPLPTGAKGHRAFVSDANSTTFGAAYVGSGSNNMPVYHDGTSWKLG